MVGFVWTCFDRVWHGDELGLANKLSVTEIHEMTLDLSSY